MENILKKRVLFFFLLIVFFPGLLNAFDSSVIITNDGTEMLRSTWTGDYDVMVKKRIIRVLMPYSKTFFFFDGATPRGLSYEVVQQFEKFINKQLKTKHLQVHVIIIPTSRRDLCKDLAKGKGDIAVGNLSITPERRKLVDFSDPFMTGVSEIIVTGPEGPEVSTLDDLSGKKIYVRKSSSYYDSLKELNEKFVTAKKEKIKIVEADENLEDEDLLEMVNAGLIPMVVIDSHKGEFWTKIFPKLKLHSNIKVKSGISIAWALRKNCPKLKKVVNEYVKKNKKGTLTGNVLFNRYLKDTKYIVNSQQGEDMKRYRDTIKYFKKYGEKYDFDYLMLAAQGYQESRLDQSRRSHTGAIGVMQILPSTARDKNVNIPDITRTEPNIHAGTKYLDFMEKRYFQDDDIDHFNKMLFSFAAYNAGPARIASMRKKAKEMGLDPNVWFKNVEVVAARQIGRETVQYVSNIYKYYISYKLLQEKMEENAKHKK